MAFFPIDRTSICFGELSFMKDPFFAFQITILAKTQCCLSIEGEHGEAAWRGCMESDRKKKR